MTSFFSEVTLNLPLI